MELIPTSSISSTTETDRLVDATLYTWKSTDMFNDADELWTLSWIADIAGTLTSSQGPADYDYDREPFAGPVAQIGVISPALSFIANELCR